MTMRFTAIGRALLFAVLLLTGVEGARAQGAGPNPAQLSSSGLQALADARLSQLVTNRVLSSVLLGVNEQVNCSNCVSGFGSVGSFSAGAHGRKAITENLAIIGGIAYSEYDRNGFEVTSAPLFALSARYDFVQWGQSRPFFDLGTVLSPWQHVRYTRNYDSTLGAFTTTASTHSANYSTFERAGYVHRATPRDEFAVAVELWQGWQRVDGYTETASGNPFTATVAGQTDRTNLFKVGGQWTHLFGSKVELNLNGGYVQTFSSSRNVTANITGAGTVTASSGEEAWAEYGARIGYRWTKSLITDVFVNGTIGNNPVGDTIHGGVGVRYTF